MKNIAKILILFLSITACSKSVLIRNLPPENGGYLLFGKNDMRVFFEPVTISDSLKLKWESSTYGSYNNSSVVAYDKYIITHDLAGYIHCFDVNDGKEIGTINYNGTIYSAPLIYKSRMFFVVNDGEEKYSTAYYYDLKDGKLISQTEIRGSFSNQVLKNDNAFYLISDNGIIYKFNFGGFNEWKYETGTQVLSTPAMKDNKIFFASTAGELLTFDYKERIITARNKIGAGIYSGISLNGKNGFTGDGNGTVYCFNTDNLQIIWKADTKKKISALPVFNERYLFVTNLSGLISCFDKSNGSLIWENKISGAPIATPLLFNNLLIQPNLDSYLYLINPVDGKLVKRIKTGGRMKLSPVYFNGLLILGYDKGNIAAYEITEVK